jgi:large-conductance mechanosensitive channel
MDQPDKTFTSEGAAARNWVGRIIVAVILGEAIWSLIVSVMNNLVVPWLGDVMGQSSGLPTAFTQRPYNYPDLFVSVVEFCFAGIVAAVLNYFFQRPKAGRTKPVRSLASIASVEPVRIVPQAAATPQAALTQSGITQATSRVAVPVPVAKVVPVAPSAPVTVAPAAPTPSIAPAAVSKPATVDSSAPPVADSAAKPLPPAPKTAPPKLETPKPKKPKEVYYNIVGEPVPSDED